MVSHIFPSSFASAAFAYPEVDVQIAGTAKLAVTNLKGDGHFVVGVQLLVEAFSRMCLEQDIVRRSDAREGQEACYRR
jgi:hypothetical protein